MKFNLLGKSITISDGCKNYMKIVADFTAMADKAVAGFDADVANMLLDIYQDNALNYYYETTVADTRRYIAQHGGYNLLESDIWNHITANDGKTDLQAEFDKMFDNICRNAPDFSSSDERTYYIVKKAKDRLNSGLFKVAVRVDVMAMCDFTWQYLYKNDLLEIKYVLQEDANKAKAIYKNLVDGTVPEDKSNALAASLIELDFSEKDYYVLIFNKFPQAKYEIASIAHFLNIDLSDLIEKEIRRDFNLKSISCEEDALKMMEDLKVSMEKFCVTSSSRKKELEKMLHNFDIKARTYDGVLYDTRALCSQAQKDDQTLFELHGDITSIGKDDCSRFLTEIVHMQCVSAVKNKHLQLLNDRITFIDNEYLGNLLSAVEVSDESECNRIKDVINQYDASQETKAPYFARVEKRIYTIWDAEDFERFTEIFIQTPVSDSEQVGKNGALIRNTGRTETKELFLNALYLLNDTEVEAAAKYAIAKEGGLFASLINMGKKEAYEILTLGGRVMHPAIQTAMEAIKAKKGTGILSGFGFGKAKSKQQPAQTQTPTVAKFCSACGSKIDGASKFCSNCGNKLN